MNKAITGSALQWSYSSIFSINQVVDLELNQIFSMIVTISLSHLQKQGKEGNFPVHLNNFLGRNHSKHQSQLYPIGCFRSSL